MVFFHGYFMENIPLKYNENPVKKPMKRARFMPHEMFLMEKYAMKNPSKWHEKFEQCFNGIFIALKTPLL